MENKTDYVTISLSLHLVFARLMKEHAFFLENSFMAKRQGVFQMKRHTIKRNLKNCCPIQLR